MASTIEATHHCGPAPEVFTGRKLALGAGALGVTNLVKVSLQLLILPIMARLLSPQEFGLYALAVPTVAFAVTLADGGLGATLARETETSTIVWSTAFWVLLATGVCLAAGVSAWGFVIGRITHQPSLPALVALMSISLVLMTSSVTSVARLTRRGRLGTLAAADLSANCVGFALAIVFARRGAGAYSLAVQYVSGFAVRAVWINLAAFRAPRAEFRLAVLRGHLATGGSMLGQRLVDFVERLTGNALFDRLLGAAPLGQYTFSTQVSRFSTEALGNPVWSAIYVQSIRLDVATAVRLHAQLFRFMAILLLPASMLVAAAAPDLVTLFLGPAWAETGLVIRIILPTYAAASISSQVGALLLARGRNDVVLWSACVASAGRIAAIASGYWLGLAGIAFGVAAANVVYCVILNVLAKRAIGLRPLELASGLLGPLLAGASAAASFLLLRGLCGSSVEALAAGLTGAVTALVLTLAAVDHRRLRSDFSTVRGLMRSSG